jgi:hypothetical protein
LTKIDKIAFNEEFISLAEVAKITGSIKESSPHC